MGMIKFFEHIAKILPENQIKEFQLSCNKQLVKSIRFLNRVDSKKKVTGFTSDTYKLETKVSWDENGFYLTKDSKPSLSFDYIRGDFYIQDASSMFPVAHLKNILNNSNIYNISNPHDKIQYILDYAASPGGKTIQLADLFSDSIIVSNDVIKGRISALYSNIIRNKLTNIILLNKDTQFFENYNLFFDIILADLPCSDESLIYKKKVDFKNWNFNEVIFNSKRQKKICSDLIRIIKKNGFLVYSTCTFSKEENEDIVEFILSHNFKKIDQKRLWPHIDNCAGGFSAFLQNNEQEKVNDKFNIQNNCKTNINELSQNNYIYESSEKLIKKLNKIDFFDLNKIKNKGYLFQKENFIYLFSFPKILKFLYDNAITFGLPIAKIEKHGVIPLWNSLNYAKNDFIIKIQKQYLEKLSKGEDLKDKSIINGISIKSKSNYLVFSDEESELFLVKLSENGIKNLIPFFLMIRN